MSPHSFSRLARARLGRIPAVITVAVLASVIVAPPVEAAPAGRPLSRIAFVLCCEDGGHYAIWTVAADGSSPRRVSNQPRGSAFTPTWSPDGSELAYAWYDNLAGGLRRVRADGSRDEVLVSLGGAAYAAQPAWSPRGDLIAFVLAGAAIGPPFYSYQWGGSRTIMLVRPAGGAFVPLTGLTGLEECPAWAPSGEAIAYAGGFGREGAPGGIFVARPTPAGYAVPRLVTPPLQQVGCPTWSPDGRHLAFWVGGGGPYSRLWIAAADGSGARPLGVQTYYSPSWSPNGRWIAYAEPQSGELRMIRPDGTEDRLVARAIHEVTSPAWAPRGSVIAYAESGLLRMVRPGARPALVFGRRHRSAMELVWAPAP